MQRWTIWGCVPAKVRPKPSMCRAFWRELHPLWDATVALQVPEAVLRARLVERWVAHGLSPEDALARAEGNDLPNARRVLTGSITADHAVATG